MGWESKRRVLALAVLTLLGACSVSGSVEDGTAPPTSTSAAASITTSPASSPTTTASASPAPASTEGCGAPAGTAWDPAATAMPTRLLERNDGLTVDIVEYPLPEHDGNPWSQWGQGVVAANGVLYSAVGDHLGTDGNSYFYAYDPSAETLTRFADVLSLVEHKAGDFGYGKVHAQMVAGTCGEVYAHTYWGTRRGLEYDDSYRGDLLLRIDPGFVELLGVTAEGRGTPSMAASADRTLLYLEAVEPESDESELVVYDLVGRQVRASLSDPHVGNRALAVDAADRVYFSSGDSRLSVYDPATNEVEEIQARMPGKILRAATPARSDGSLIGVTDNPDEFFVLEADGSLRDLGRAAGYTASLAMTSDGRRVYYVPGAHGNSWEMGTPVIELDYETGLQTTIVELHDLAENSLGVRLGGSYNVVMDPSGQRLYVGLNAGEDGESFGRVFLAIIALP